MHATIKIRLRKGISTENQRRTVTETNGTRTERVTFVNLAVEPLQTLLIVSVREIGEHFLKSFHHDRLHLLMCLVDVL